MQYETIPTGLALPLIDLFLFPMIPHPYTPDSRCFLAGGQVLNLGESAILITVSPEDQTLAADVILLVDESSSMVMEHDWIPGMIRQLDTALQVRDSRTHYL